MKTIITIGRQYGSGGHEIGRKVAEKLGVPFYDKELLARAAKESGFSEEMIRNHDERPTSSFLYNVAMDNFGLAISNTNADLPIGQKVFLAQFDAVKTIAKEGACVIVGRCADYALRDMDNCLNIFIFGKEEKKAQRVSSIFNITMEEAKKVCVKQDKKRQSYYNYYSDKKWGRADSYDVCIDSGKLGIDGTVDMIIDYVKRLEK
jgi:cytidylate kinase